MQFFLLSSVMAVGIFLRTLHIRSLHLEHVDQRWCHYESDYRNVMERFSVSEDAKSLPDIRS